MTFFISGIPPLRTFVPRKSCFSGARSLSPLHGLQEMGAKRVLFREANQTMLRSSPVINLSPRFSPYSSVIEETFVLLCGLAGLRLSPQSRVSFSTLLMQAGVPYMPLGWAFSDEWHQASIFVHQACLEPDPVFYLKKKCGYSKKAIEHFLGALPLEVQKLMSFQAQGKGIETEKLFTAVATAELTHAAHLLLENRLGLPNFCQEAAGESETLPPSRTRYVLAELAEHLSGQLWFDPREIVRLKTIYSLLVHPPELESAKSNLMWIHFTGLFPGDFEFGDLFTKSLLDITLQENAHAMAEAIEQALLTKLSCWYLKGQVRSDSQILGVLRLWFLYSLFAYPVRQDIVRSSEGERLLRVADLELLIICLAQTLALPVEGQIPGARIADNRVYAYLKILVMGHKKLLQKEMAALLIKYELFAGKKKAGELKQAVTSAIKAENPYAIHPRRKEAFQRVNGFTNRALMEAGREMAAVENPAQLVRLVLDKLARIRQIAHGRLSPSAAVFSELDTLEASIRNETFGAGRNLDNPVFSRMMRDWENYDLPDDYFSRFMADPEKFIASTPWMLVFDAAERLNTLPGEADVPNFPLTRPY